MENVNLIQPYFHLIYPSQNNLCSKIPQIHQTLLLILEIVETQKKGN